MTPEASLMYAGTSTISEGKHLVPRADKLQVWLNKIKALVFTYIFLLKFQERNKKEGREEESLRKLFSLKGFSLINISNK